MIFSRLLKIVSAFGRIGTAKSNSVKNADEIIAAVESGIMDSAQSASEKPLSLGERMITVKSAKQKLIDWCKSQVGYHEGYDGSNKYADGQWDVKLYGFSAISVPWCDVFVDAAYIACFGFDDATAMTYQQPHGYAACSLSADAYKRNGAFYDIPEVGDQIFFYSGNGINHTGIVIEVRNDTIVCVEGNFADKVARTQYNIPNKMIAGYGRPNWAVVAEPESFETPVDYGEVLDEFDIIHPEHRRTYQHLQYGDGIGMPLAPVRAWQSLLQCWGYALDADGEFGFDTENATRQWQQRAQEIGADVEINGIVDEDDWIEIINLPGGD